MPTAPGPGRRSAGRPLKSPLAVAAGHSSRPPAASAPHDSPVPSRIVLSDRETTLTEFEDYLRTVNNRDGRPYEEKTISAYAGPGKHLDKWLTSQGIDGDFTVADTALLNRYFREYYLEHGQGGTH